MSNFNYAQPFIVVGAFIVRDEKVLLIKENHEPDKGTWNLPGGKLDVGESLADAAIREVHEEAGLSFTPEQLIGIHTVYRPHMTSGKSPHISVLRVYFVGEVEGEVNVSHGEAVNGVEEIAEYRWFTTDEVLALKNSQLRYHDIRDLVHNHLAGKTYPLELMSHFVQS